MQQGVMPFNPNPRSFAFAVVLFIGLVYVIRILRRQVLLYGLLLRRRIAEWIKREKQEQSSDENPVIELADIYPARRSLCGYTNMDPEDVNELRRCEAGNASGPAIAGP
jgi:hypothetical protein